MLNESGMLMSRLFIRRCRYFSVFFSTDPDSKLFDQGPKRCPKHISGGQTKPSRTLRVNNFATNHYIAMTLHSRHNADVLNIS